MIILKTFEDHVKEFNSMFNQLNPADYDYFTFEMASAVEEKVKQTTTSKFKIKNVEKWCDEML